MTPEELARVADIVNAAILEGYEVRTDEMPLEEAKKLGAMALFGEKYSETVRVVRMGDFSAELCGGTHLGNTAKAGTFRITSEFSVAAGVRRIEAITGRACLEEMDRNRRVIIGVAEALKTTPSDVEEKARQCAAEIRPSGRT